MIFNKYIQSTSPMNRMITPLSSDPLPIFDSFDGTPPVSARVLPGNDVEATFVRSFMFISQYFENIYVQTKSSGIINVKIHVNLYSNLITLYNLTPKDPPAACTIACIDDLQMKHLSDFQHDCSQKPGDIHERSGPVCSTRTLDKNQRQTAREMTEVIANPEQTELSNDYRKVDNISDEHADLLQEITDILADFNPMGDAHLVTINAVEHHIDSPPEFGPVNRHSTVLSRHNANFHRRKSTARCRRVSWSPQGPSMRSRRFFLKKTAASDFSPIIYG